MGILNVTPDSFSDGGQYSTLERALFRAKQMLSEGVDIIDIGGESTRPGAPEVSLDDELQRVLPVIHALCGDPQLGHLPISIDTSKPEVMSAAVEAGASMVNDVRALQAQGAMTVCAKLNVPVCLMHMQGEPRSMQLKPQYEDVVASVVQFLKQQADLCLKAGIKNEHIILDPGFGFGKSLAHNLSLLRELGDIAKIGQPVLVGLSRKSMFKEILGAQLEQRLSASLAAAVLAMDKGAKILRVHDVKATVDAVAVFSAVNNP
jgi:dihydropteroate synthase